jgi:hypothetical protein
MPIGSARPSRDAIDLPSGVADARVEPVDDRRAPRVHRLAEGRGRNQRVGQRRRGRNRGSTAAAADVTATAAVPGQHVRRDGRRGPDGVAAATPLLLLLLLLRRRHRLVVRRQRERIVAGAVDVEAVARVELPQFAFEEVAVRRRGQLDRSCALA